MTDKSLTYARKYRSSTLAEYVGNQKAKDTVLKVLASGERPQVLLLWGSSGCGKAQPLDSLVLTVDGYKKMGDIRVGDLVYTHSGCIAPVTGIFPQGYLPVYRLTFNDYTSTRVADTHLNWVYTVDSRHYRYYESIETLNLIDRFNSGERFYIDRPVVSWGKRVLPADLYEFGLIFGSTMRYDGRGISTDILYNSVGIRADFLAGILKAVGTVTKKDNIKVVINDKVMSDDFAFLVRSLGISDKVYCDEGIYRHYIILDSSVNLRGIDLARRYSVKRELISIEELEPAECQCIMVGHADHTYITDDFIPTHNTTLARLIAKEYSCEHRDNERGACDKCISCQAINDYITTGTTDSVANIREIDITDQSGKRDLDEVLADMELPSYDGEWKVYILDECHEAGSALQNRLLKVAEEPPENVLIILCTTNPERLLPTLRNRCQLQVQITKPKPRELMSLLKRVCQSEGVSFDVKGLEFITQRSELTIRTALHQLWQIVAQEGSATYDHAIRVFDAISNEVIVKIFKALKSHNTFEYVTLLNDIKSRMELNVFVTELANFVKRGIYTINGITLEGITDAEIGMYRDLFGDLGVAKIGFLLNRILTLNQSSLEIELLMLGYSGLDSSYTGTDSKPLVIEPVPNELEGEKAIANKVLANSQQVDYDKGILNAEKLKSATDINDLLNFGAELIN